MKRISLIVVTGCIVLITLAMNRELGVEDVFNRISKIERFESMSFEDGIMGFPKGLGVARMTIHPNASPRTEVLKLLERLPKESLVYDHTDEEGRFDRIYLENGTTMFYVHVGHRTGDTIAILFKNCDKEKLALFLADINAELSKE